MSGDWRLRVEDILEAIERISRCTQNMDEVAFTADDKTVDAVIRNMTVIGEAANYIPEDIQLSYPEIPWAKMRAFRNVVVHEYFGVSNAILWQTIQTNLPSLVNPLQAMLAGNS